MNKNFNDFFKLYERKIDSQVLESILDIPILLFEESGYNGNCYTDLDALKQYYIDMYMDNHEDDPEECEELIKNVKRKKSLESFDTFDEYKEIGFNKYLDSIRDTIVENFRDKGVHVSPENIIYEESSSHILVPVDNPNDDTWYLVYEIDNEGIFGTDTCIGSRDFEYDEDRELVYIDADFSSLNAEYPKK